MDPILLKRLVISVAIAAGLSGCAAGSMTVKPPSPPIPGVGRVRSITVLPVRFVLRRSRFSVPDPESMTGSLSPETGSVLKLEIERLVSRSGFGLRRLDMDDSTLQRRPWLSGLTRAHVEHPDRALLRVIASPDSVPMSTVIPQTTPMDIADFVVDSTGAQYLLFVQGCGFYAADAGAKWFDETVPKAAAVAVLGAILGVHAVPDTDLEESAVETEFFLEARLVDIADRQILWHNSVFFEKRLQEDETHFNPKKGEDLRAACEQLLRPLLQAPR